MCHGIHALCIVLFFKNTFEEVCDFHQSFCGVFKLASFRSVGSMVLPLTGWYCVPIPVCMVFLWKFHQTLCFCIVWCLFWSDTIKLFMIWSDTVKLFMILSDTVKLFRFWSLIFALSAWYCVPIPV